MSVPKAVQAMADEAEKALEAFGAPAGNEAVEEATVETQEQPGQQPEKPAASPELQALERELELERQRSASMKGRLEAQSAALAREKQEMQQRMSTLEATINELKKASAVPGPRRYISEEEAKDLGDDVLGVQQRIIKGTLEEELDGGTIRDWVSELVKQSIASQQVSVKEPNAVNENLFWQAVERYYPNARTINDTDRSWFDFLDKFDPNSGLMNRDVGVRAIDAGDIVSMVDLLNRYKPAKGHVVGRAAPKPESSSTATVVAKESSKEVWKQEEIERFYNDVATGRFRGTKAEAQAIENQIMEAAQEGRIR